MCMWSVCLPAQSLQSSQTLWSCNCSLPGSSVRGIHQARIQEWVAMPSPRGSSWPRGRIWVSCIAGEVFTAEPLGVHTMYVEYIQLNQHCSTIIKFNVYMNTRNTIMSFYFQVWPHLAWPFSSGSLYNSSHSFICTTRCEYLLFYKSILFRKICLEGRSNTWIPLGSEFRILVHRKKASVLYWFCRNTW